MGHLYVLLGDMSNRILCPFFNWIVCSPVVESYEYFTYFGDQTLVRCNIDKYVLLMVASFFILMMVALASQKLFIWWSLICYFFSYFSFCRGYNGENIVCGISEILVPMFSARIFMVSQLIFYKSFIHFVFIVVYGISWWCSFIFFACTSPVLPTPFIEESVFTP